MRGMRAPMTVAPADGCGVARGRSRAPTPPAAIFAARPSNSPRRISSRFLPLRASTPRPRRDRRAHPIARPPSADLARQRDAIGHGHAFDRDERDDIHGSEPRVLAAVRAKVHRPRCVRSPPEAGSPTRRLSDVACKREDAAVVRGIGLHVEHAKPGHRTAARRQYPRRPRCRPPSLILGTHSMMAIGVMLPSALSALPAPCP